MRRKKQLKLIPFMKKRRQPTIAGTLAARLESAMLQRGMNQTRLRAASKVAHSTVSQLINGHIVKPEWDTVTKLANALQVSPRWLMDGGEEEMEEKKPNPLGALPPQTALRLLKLSMAKGPHSKEELEAMHVLLDAIEVAIK